LIQLRTLSEEQPTLWRRRVHHRCPIQRQRLLHLTQGQLRQTQLLTHHHHPMIRSLANILKGGE
tara:strand:+ start:281 stop:472 length:192 start_codon:yes stop_codon:yes gene_type:complete